MGYGLLAKPVILSPFAEFTLSSCEGLRAGSAKGRVVIHSFRTTAAGLLRACRPFGTLRAGSRNDWVMPVTAPLRCRVYTQPSNCQPDSHGR